MTKNPKILSIVLAGGEGTRLMPLTRDRAKPAVPFDPTPSSAEVPSFIPPAAQRCVHWKARNVLQMSAENTASTDW